jgi:hypothetical protein
MSVISAANPVLTTTVGLADPALTGNGSAPAPAQPPTTAGGSLSAPATPPPLPRTLTTPANPTSRDPALDLQNLFERAADGAPHTINREFIEGLVGRPGAQVIPGVKLLSSGDAAQDRAALDQLRAFFAQDPDLARGLTAAAKSAPVYVIIGSQETFAPTGDNTLAINFGADDGRGQLAGHVVGLQRSSLSADFSTLENEFRETAMRGALGKQTPRNSSQEAASLTISSMYAALRDGSLKPASAADLYRGVLQFFRNADQAYRAVSSQTGPPPQHAQQIVEMLNSRMSELGLSDFADGKVHFTLIDGNIVPALMPRRQNATPDAAR